MSFKDKLDNMFKGESRSDDGATDQVAGKSATASAGFFSNLFAKQELRALDAGVSEKILNEVGNRPRPLPIIGLMTPQAQYYVGGTMVLSFLIAAGVVGYIGTRDSGYDNTRTATATKVQMLSQRLAAAAHQAVQGDLFSINKMREVRTDLEQEMKILTDGDASRGMPGLADSNLDELFHLQQNVRGLEARVSKLIDLSGALIGIDVYSSKLETMTGTLFTKADQLQSTLAGAGGTPAQVAAAEHLRVLAQRIRSNGIALLRSPDATADSLAQILADDKEFATILKSLSEGSANLKLSAVGNPQARDLIKDMASAQAKGKTAMEFVEKNASSIVAARAGQGSMSTVSDAVLRDARRLAEHMLDKSAGDEGLQFTAALLLLGAMLSIFLVVLVNNRLTKIGAWNSTLTNKKNEADIINFMTAIFPLEVGDLTVNFTGDTLAMDGITGGIRSSVNEAVTSVREAVTSVKSTANDVSSIVESSVSTTQELEESNRRQAAEIHDVVSQVGQLASAITQVTEKTLRAAKIAQEVRSAAAEGENVVVLNNEKMSQIRSGMQEVLKSVKHSGETSQEITSIVEAIDGITDRTQIIAVNSSLEAAKAGAAGAPFKVLAGEVNRLAEQSKELQMTIAALVQRNQGETAATIKLVEDATNAVVDGAKLSERANAELRKISEISEMIAKFMDEIRHQSEEQNNSATGVSQSMERLLNMSREFQESVTSVVTSVQKIDDSMGSLKNTVSAFTTE